MADGFTRKKVESLMLGEKLKKLRQQYRMSYAEIAKATRIQAKYLESLENGEYEKLPAEVYVRGFLKSYARHLGLDDDAFLKLYDKEKHIRENLGREQSSKEAIRYPALNTWIVTPRTVLIASLVLVLGGTFLYLFSEFRNFVAEPRLVIIEPLAGATIDSTETLFRGKTDPGAKVTLNGDPVFIGSDGSFEEQLVLQSGLNRITVRATNRFDKTKEETIAIESRVVLETVPDAPEGVSPDGGFTFTVRASSRPVDVTVVSAETVLYSGTLLAGKEERFTGLTDAVRLTTNDALHTEVGIDSGPIEPIGTETTAVSGKVYSRENKTIPR
jgi:transcriptional regulator with XRE-family HTH domain